MIFGSLFSGVGGFDLGLERAGMTCGWQVDNDPFCLRILAKHWPEVDRYGDIREFPPANICRPDIIVGGFPCQDLSIAGRREGLAGERSGLWYEFYRVLAELKPAWIVIENVTGLLSSNGGRDFATILQGLVKLRYGVCWRVFDAKHFGVPQRRRRVFLVGHLGDDGRAAQVLFESESSERGAPASQGARQDIAAPLKASSPGRRGGGSSPIAGEFVIANAITTRPGQRLSAEDNYVAFNWQSGGDVRLGCSGEHVPALQASQVPAVAGSWGVRRFTPLECERLMGFPDNWTLVEGTSDTARYRQLGNAVVVPVVEWIGRQIVEADQGGLNAK